jgi:adenylate kinase family enzyme
VGAGAGKTRLAAEVAARLDGPHVERDALGELGSAEYRAAVARVSREEAWVFDGAPYYVDDIVYPRAQLVVALDYPRRVVMRRVVWRALRRPDTRSWRDPHHPVQWAWSVCAQRRDEIAELERRPALAVIGFSSTAAARRWVATVE